MSKFSIFDFDLYLNSGDFFEDYELKRNRDGMFTWVVRVKNDPSEPIIFSNFGVFNQKRVLHKTGNLMKAFAYFKKKFSNVKTFTPAALFNYMGAL